MNSVSSRSAQPEADGGVRHALPALQRRSRDTRARILKAAEASFARSGYDGARMGDIAERAGCSVGALYFRFRDKSALFLAIAEAFADEARANLLNHIPAMKGAPREVIVTRFVTDTARRMRRHRGLFRAIVEGGLEHAQAMRAIFSLRDECADVLTGVLQAKTQGDKSLPLKVRVMTQMVYGFVVAGTLNPNAPTKIADARAIAELAHACNAYLCGDES
jgi:AcrR family transcriptional regulator